MALASSPSTSPEGLVLPAEVIRAVVQFLSGVHSIASVQHVAASSDSTQTQIWILMSKEVLDDERRVYDLEYDLRRSIGAVPLNVHVIPLSEIDPTSLPPTETLFER